RERRRLLGSEIVKINIAVAIDVGRPGSCSSIGRKVTRADLPFILGEPVDFLRGDIKQANVLISVPSIRSDKHLLSVRRDVACAVKMLSFMGREQRALSRCQLRNK